MVKIEIHEQACRGCKLCVEVCPTKVLAYDETKKKAYVDVIEDCIACLSCNYLCPSGALTHWDYPVVKNFYRDLKFSQRTENFL